MQPNRGKLEEFNVYFTNGSKVGFEAQSYDEIKANIKTHFNFTHIHSKNGDSAHTDCEDYLFVLKQINLLS